MPASKNTRRRRSPQLTTTNTARLTRNHSSNSLWKAPTMCPAYNFIAPIIYLEVRRRYGKNPEVGTGFCLLAPGGAHTKRNDLLALVAPVSTRSAQSLAARPEDSAAPRHSLDRVSPLACIQPLQDQFCQVCRKPRQDCYAVWHSSDHT